MVSFNEVRRFYHELQATLSANVCYCITAKKNLSLHFIVRGLGSVSFDFIFQIMLGGFMEHIVIISSLSSK